MDLGLADARVIVTGGASNIGRGIVHGFAREGARAVAVIVSGLTLSRFESSFESSAFREWGDRHGRRRPALSGHRGRLGHR